MWDIIKKLVENGTTIMLTTQYLEEADQLADRIVVIDDGKVIAEGTASELKRKIGKDRLEITLKSRKGFEQAVQILGKEVVDSDTDEQTVVIIIMDSHNDVRRVLESLDNQNVTIESLAIHKPTLDDVFLSLTGKQKQTIGEEA